MDTEQGEAASGGEHVAETRRANRARGAANVSAPSRSCRDWRATGVGLPRSVGGVTAARQELGDRVEELVAARLERQGYAIVARNARPPGRRGEIDIVARDHSALVFVEVKARREGSIGGPEAPALAVGPRKQAQLRRLAIAWLGAQRGRLTGASELRFDVVGVVVAADGSVRQLEHIRRAF
jgi:putative endonuclease